MLGRPFGVPNDAAFQRRVLTALLRLFAAPRGPVLEDYPEDAPADPGDQEGYACPVNFVRTDGAGAHVGPSLLNEIDQLAAWHELARKRRGRSTVGISGMPIREAARLIASYLGAAPLANPQPDASLGTVLKRCCDDIKAYYFEALGAQPGQLSARAVDRAFWQETAAGRVFIALREAGVRHADKSFAAFADRSLVPRAVLHALANRSGR
jgi:phage gp36-like protein